MGFVQLFLTDQFQRDFNCSFYNVDSIPLSERVHLGSGIALGVMGIVFEVCSRSVRPPHGIILVTQRSLRLRFKPQACQGNKLLLRVDAYDVHL